ncbi:hypothetical protein CALCODRAFT_477969 [Calocera cornea HHB12733]|uniref:AttH domain-containing protein n=1 Tax=Calocera cornea HHB12733 TaxID=1353952 RepID=A0A165CH32_9BASI|nr:hypothetical protein CALCODRAFT_477969 [Calocera cornea HHB12733]
MLYFLLTLSLVGLAQAISVDIYPPYPINGSSTAQYTVDGPFDRPKLDFFNQTSYQWWYIDAVSSDVKQSAVFVFAINSIGASGDPASPFNVVEVNVAFEDGTLGAAAVPAGNVVIATVGDGASGIFNGTGYSWYESSDLSTFYIDINDPVNNITGSLKLSSIGPHHAQCGPATKGASLLVVPHLGWANSIPDADAVVDINFNGKPLKFTGVGYHDSNWGDQGLLEQLGTWYWGHTRVGPYGVVWFDTTDINGVEHQSGYVSKHGAVLAESCGSMSVRPTGQNSTYPPLPGASPSGFHIVYDMGPAGVLEVNITNYETVENTEPLYERWVGTSVGGIRGREVHNGVGLYEWLGG